MSDAPERIWATGNETTGSWNHEKVRMRKWMPDNWQTEYIRKDIVEARIADAMANQWGGPNDP